MASSSSRSGKDPRMAAARSAVAEGVVAEDFPLKWSFAFWLGQVFAIVGFLALLLRTIGR